MLPNYYNFSMKTKPMQIGFFSKVAWNLAFYNFASDTYPLILTLKQIHIEK